MTLYERLKRIPLDQLEKVLEAATVYSEREMKEQYDEMLDDCYGVVKIGTYEYETSTTMKNVDPTAYNCGFNNYVDEREDILEFEGRYYAAQSIEDALDQGEEYVAS
jgi:hypothetical protein